MNMTDTRPEPQDYLDVMLERWGEDDDFDVTDMVHIIQDGDEGAWVTVRVWVSDDEARKEP